MVGLDIQGRAPFVDGSIGKYPQGELWDSTHPETATKSNGFHRIIGLSSHCIRLMDVAGTGLRMYLAEKRARKLGAGLDRTLSPVRLEGRTY